ncbi:MAG TPA: YbaK/EbsC family protein [Thermoleophilaceae bacterium]|jgi:prolyl-tRNA editing enzyme YbaK/EbsC (Cys-tRNA(Pro) deacylase)|nr:YbaK/EbsC family protein [Thermoleophilaceae bacterium]
MRSKVKEAARELGLDIELRTLEDSTATVGQAASALGVEEGQIAKSIVFVMDGEPVVVVASGRHRIDLDKVCEALDCAEGRIASSDEVRAATGFPIGGVPPIGHGLPVVFDTALLDYDVIYAAGGDGNTLFAVAPRPLAGSVHALVAPMGE